MSSPDTTPSEGTVDPDRVVVRDKRRLDPETGAVREPEPAASPPEDPPAPADAAQEVQVEEAAPDPVAELTDTLQRVQAEYANFRKRVERDKVAMVEQAAGSLLLQLLPLLDDVERARQHDDLGGAFKTVGEGLEAVVARLGLERFGAPGDAFDPQVHEAVMQGEPDPASTVATCAQVFRQGARIGGRVLRPAQVVVAEPGGTAPADG